MQCRRLTGFAQLERENADDFFFPKDEGTLSNQNRRKFALPQPPRRAVLLFLFGGGGTAAYLKWLLYLRKK
jgi:hypothetical protein